MLIKLTNIKINRIEIILLGLHLFLTLIVYFISL